MNLCESHLIVSGDHDERDRMLSDLGGVDRFGQEIAIDFNKVIPEPLVLRSDPSRQLDWRAAQWGVIAQPGTQENYVDPFDFDAEDGLADPEQTTIVLVTKDGPPLPVIDRIASTYPTLGFALSYFEGGHSLAGYVRYEGGAKAEEETAAKTTDAILDLLDRRAPRLAEAARSEAGLDD